MNLKRIVEIFPLLGALLIFIGNLKLSLYYGYWNIDIISYLDFSEIVLSFFNNLNTLVFFIVIFIFHTVIGASTIRVLETRLKRNNSLISDQLPEPKVGLTSFRVGVLSGMLVSSILFFSLFIVFTNLIFLYFSFFFLFSLLYLFFEKIMGILNDNIIFMISSIGVLVSFTIGIAWHEVKRTENNPKRVEIFLENETFSSNDKLLFIGRTSNYYFFYDESQKQAITFPVTEIKKETQINLTK